MWRNWNAHELLVGIQNSTVAVEKQFGVKKKLGVLATKSNGDPSRNFPGKTKPV